MLWIWSVFPLLKSVQIQVLCVLGKNVICLIENPLNNIGYENHEFILDYD